MADGEAVAERELESVRDCEEDSDRDSEAMVEAVVDGVSDAVRLLESLSECDVVSDGEAD